MSETDRYGQHRNPSTRRVSFPQQRADIEKWSTLQDSGEVTDLPIYDAEHRQIRGRVIRVADMVVAVEITAEIEIQ